MRAIRKIERVAFGVFAVEGPESNWVILRGEEQTALIDTGYPADYELLVESISRVGGSFEAIDSILVTHGHADHIGNAERLSQVSGARVYAHTDEVANVRRTEMHQVGVAQVLPRILEWRIARWALRAVASGGLSAAGIPLAHGLADRQRVVAGGHQVELLLTAGHSPGHASYWLPDAQVLVTGDTLVTAHPTSEFVGPQLLLDMFHSRPADVPSALDAFRGLEPCAVVPGHGPVLSPVASMTDVLASIDDRRLLAAQRHGAHHRHLPHPTYQLATHRWFS